MLVGTRYLEKENSETKITHLSLTSTHWNSDSPTRARNNGSTAQHLDHALRSIKSRVRNNLRVIRTCTSLVAKNTDNLSPAEPLAHGDRGGVAIDGVGLVRHKIGVDVHGPVAQLVDHADEAVERRGGIVPRQPDGLAVVWRVGAVQVLFLAFVDDRDAV